MRVQNTVLIVLFVLMVGTVSGLLVFSERGILELRALGQQMDRTRASIRKLEEENRNLRRQLDLLRSANSEEIIESRARERYHWVKENETVYLY